jgi:hypothetical protein
VVRTIAIKVEDEVHQQLTLLAQLSERPLVDELREAVDAHIARRSAEVDLTAQAQAALEEIDREAANRRQAIEALLTKRSGASEQTAPKPRRRGREAKSEE